MSEISERILERIKQSNTSYGDLSKVTGIPKSALQRYATGETEKIPLDRLEKIAAALGVSAAYLMGWKYDPETTSDEMLALMVDVAEEERSGRNPAINAMLSKFGDKYSTHIIGVAGKKHNILYYHAFEDKRSRDAASELLGIIEAISPAAAEELLMRVKAYREADARAKEIVDLALLPFVHQPE